MSFNYDFKTIIQLGKQTILQEISEISNIVENINDDFASVVQLILNSNGRVIISGIGKSAIIAQKIVATLNSTGTPSIFMHAADAIHGDLGIIQKNDVVIVISKSGNTPEIKALCPLIKKFGNTLVAIVGNNNSELANAADFVLDVTIQKEACPNNLAPTTSTTAQLVMGDALAVALLQSRKFTSSDFSKYHPGGSLGKQLFLTCGNIAEKNYQPQVDIYAPVKEVIINISKNRMGATAVIENNTIIGIITDGDIRRMIEKDLILNEVKAIDIMSKHPITIDEQELAINCSELMKEKKISQIIVSKNNEYFGMIHIHDLNKEGLL